VHLLPQSRNSETGREEVTEKVNVRERKKQGPLGLLNNGRKGKRREGGGVGIRHGKRQGPLIHLPESKKKRVEGRERREK